MTKEQLQENDLTLSAQHFILEKAKNERYFAAVCPSSCMACQEEEG